VTAGRSGLITSARARLSDGHIAANKGRAVSCSVPTASSLTSQSSRRRSSQLQRIGMTISKAAKALANGLASAGLSRERRVHAIDRAFMLVRDPPAPEGANGECCGSAQPAVPGAGPA
jgi:hypothetical protein